MFFSAFIDRLATRRLRRRATMQLRALSDRQLDELGLSRQAITEGFRGRKN